MYERTSKRDVTSSEQRRYCIVVMDRVPPVLGTLSTLPSLRRRGKLNGASNTVSRVFEVHNSP
jgi:hypothetical protein